MRRLAVLYFAFQGLAVVGWWALLLLAPFARRYFLPPDTPESVLLAFWLPDLLLIAAASLVGGALVARRHRLSLVVLCLASGATGYASLYCLSLSLLTDSAWLSVVLMLPSALLSVSFTVGLLAAETPLFRQARSASPRQNLAKTAFHILLFWSTLLFLVPYGLLHVEQRLGVPRLHFPGQVAAAGILFILLSACALWSGYTMASRGSGTPLPLDSPGRLVTAGPYAYLRNPMAMASLGQGAAVGLGLGSPLVIAYVLLGAFIWQWIARPLEEDHLQELFGAAYEAYRREVRCWYPRLLPYRPSENAERWPADPDAAVEAGPCT